MEGDDTVFVGRKKETELLKNSLQQEGSCFIAVYGRRRIGKTFLVRETLGSHFTFQHAGLSAGTLKEQLFAFSSSLRLAGYTMQKKPKNWLEAFEGLKQLILDSKESKKVIFIDELSWMDTPKSDLLTALENFWNGFASARKDIVLIVCASATSWILSHVVHNKGGLYNRLTDQIHLQSFTLHECEEYVHASELIMNRQQILQYYMIFGGVPFYWSFIRKGYSVPQNIDRILFSENAPLKDEYRYLYASVFRSPEYYIKIIEALSQKKAGMTRDELVEGSGLQNSGDLTRRLEELESCGFIRRYYAYGMKSKNTVFQLIDCFTLFALRFMNVRTTDGHFWSNQINTPAVNTWSGLAFERVCLLHIPSIKAALGIAGVLSEVNSWYCKADPDAGIHGSQIDLLIVRKDGVINLCEMKYSDTEFCVTESEERKIRIRIHDLQTKTGTKYAIFPTLVTTHGIMENIHSGIISSVVTLDDLFT